MTIMAEKSSDGKTITIRTDNKVDYNAQTDFRACYSEEKDHDITYIIDMRDTSYMDSSSLGILLLLREHVGNDRNRISICNCSRDIKNILEISNFDRLFTIE